MVEIRGATRAELPVLLALARSFYDEDGFTTTDAELERNFGVLFEARNAHIVLAVLGDRVVGFALTTTAFVLESGVVAEVQDLYVTPDARRSGVGSALLDDAADWARSQSARQLEVVVAPNGRDVAHLFAYYRGHGFTDEGRRILAQELE